LIRAAFSSVGSAHNRSFRNHFLITLAAGLLVTTTLVCSSADAQSSRRVPGGKSADQIVSDMKNRLNLTDEQEAKIRPIIEEQSKNRAALIEKYRGQGREGMGSLRNELQELNQRTENQLQSILTKEQMEEYQKMQTEEREQMRKGSRSRRSG
jgi:Spy/CpxP family protein refolding chaperone